MVREVDLSTFAAAHPDGAVVIDVHEPGEYLVGYVPGAKLLPLGARARPAARYRPAGGYRAARERRLTGTGCARPGYRT